MNGPHKTDYQTTLFNTGELSMIDFTPVCFQWFWDTCMITIV